MGTSATDHTDIQAILQGFGHQYKVARYVMIRLSDSPTVNQGFLQRLPGALGIAEVPTSVQTLNGNQPPVAVTTAFSYQGLEKLGVPSTTLTTFPEDFSAGMASRAAINCDTGRSAPNEWESFWGDGVDVLIGIIAGSNELATEAHERLWTLLGAFEAERGDVPDPIVEAGSDQGQRIYGPIRDGYERPIEHFGFRDGVSNTPIRGLIDDSSPKVRGAGRLDAKGDWHPIAAGEFLFGYNDEIGESPESPQPASIAQNGTFLVYRKLSQNVELFRRYLDDVAAQLGLDPAMVAEKMVGRRKNGDPLVETFNGLNDFDFAEDPHGRQCPLGSHVRRTNPRDSLGFQSLLVDRHRMARRGITYGEPAEVGNADPSNDDPFPDRGLLFLALNIDIARQFEFVQSEWVNFGNDFDQGSDCDPLTGSHGHGEGRMALHYDNQNPAITCSAIPRFVETRGGEYFFVPGCDGYRLIIEGKFGPSL